MRASASAIPEPVRGDGGPLPLVEGHVLVLTPNTHSHPRGFRVHVFDVPAHVVEGFSEVSAGGVPGINSVGSAGGVWQVGPLVRRRVVRVCRLVRVSEDSEDSMASELSESAEYVQTTDF